MIIIAPIGLIPGKKAKRILETMLIAITIATKINSSSFGLDSSNDKKKGINANIAIKQK